MVMERGVDAAWSLDISADKSQRDFASKPRVARHELPWEIGPDVNNPERVATQVGVSLAAPLVKGVAAERKLCRNHYLWFTFIRFSPPKSVVHFCAIIGFGRRVHAYLGEVSKRLGYPPRRRNPVGVLAEPDDFPG